MIVDLFSRQVVGWALAERMTAELVCQALQMALWRRKMPKGVILLLTKGLLGRVNKKAEINPSKLGADMALHSFN